MAQKPMPPQPQEEKKKDRKCSKKLEEAERLYGLFLFEEAVEQYNSYEKCGGNKEKKFEDLRRLIHTIKKVVPKEKPDKKNLKEIKSDMSFYLDEMKKHDNNNKKAFEYDNFVNYLWGYYREKKKKPEYIGAFFYDNYSKYFREIGKEEMIFPFIMEKIRREPNMGKKLKDELIKFKDNFEEKLKNKNEKTRTISEIKGIVQTLIALFKDKNLIDNFGREETDLSRQLKNEEQTQGHPEDTACTAPKKSVPKKDVTEDKSQYLPQRERNSPNKPQGHLTEEDASPPTEREQPSNYNFEGGGR